MNLHLMTQSFGRFLSGMIMPNIGAFVAWGLITSLFIPVGWLPNENLAKLVGPMITYLLPILIGYSGGKLVGGDRGAVMGAIVTAGVVIGASVPMFFGAMLMGPLAGYVIRVFDRAVDGRIPAGFEMLVNNFSIGILGGGLALIAYLVVGPAVTIGTKWFAVMVQHIVNAGLLPLTSILVEPAKILFLNNAINHGIFTPLGTQQVTEQGRSIYFLIEANPGPGMGLLLAYIAFGGGNLRSSAFGASIIHFLGGIHEVYFPFVLMRPILILAVIAGGMTGVFVNVILQGGLIAPAAPGSIFAVLIATPKGSYFASILSVLLAGTVSFVVAAFLMLFKKKEGGIEDLQSAKAQTASFKGKTSTASANAASSEATSEHAGGVEKAVEKIVFACDAGMGSSAMGATLLRKELDKAGLSHITVINKAINELDGGDIVITQTQLSARAKAKLPNANHLSIGNFMDKAFYENLAKELKG